MSKKNPGAKRKATHVTCSAPAATEVSLAGTFNGWEPGVTPMHRGPNGKWQAKLDLPPGRHEFKFVVDGAWCCEPGIPDGPCVGDGLVPNEFGTSNCVIDVR